MKYLPDGRIVFEAPAEVPPVALSLATTGYNRTGDWRTREPVFRDLRPPCAAGCPTGQDVVDVVRLFAQGQVRQAGEVVLASNPFPATTGRVCPHPCVTACNRGRLDAALDIPGIERALGDALLRERLGPPRRGCGEGRVAVVGAGPAGLAAAHYLALAGHAVTLHAREGRPGGLLRTGIPPYRLPRSVLDAEIERALAPGVRFEGGRTLGRDFALPKLVREFDAVLLAIGLHAPRSLGIPGEDERGVVDGLGLLDALHRGEPAPEGKDVIVLGGGNTALDCARSLRRLGRQVTIAYRRGRSEMPAFADEVEEALEEGVRIEEWTVPLRLRSSGGWVRWLQLSRARPGAKDASGRARPEPIRGSEFVLPADLVVVAAGETLDAEGLPEALVRDGAVFSAPTRSLAEGVYACGDCTGGGGTVSFAIGSGRRAAAEVCAALGGEPPLVDPVSARGAGADIAGWDRMRPFYFRRAPARARGRVDPEQRLRGVAEVRLGYLEADARAEAGRCLSCGTCSGCDNCYQLCPDRAVVRGAPGRYDVDRSRCKGCGVCFQECPRGAVGLRDRGGA